MKHDLPWNSKISVSVKRSWGLTNLKRKTCASCFVVFVPTGRRQKYCGSNRKRTGCSWAKNRGDGYRVKLIGLKNYSCESCGIKNQNPSFFDVDHIKPILRRTNGLRDSARFVKKSCVENLQVLCPNCHRLKTIHNKEFWIARGFWLKAKRTPFIDARFLLLPRFPHEPWCLLS